MFLPHSDSSLVDSLPANRSLKLHGLNRNCSVIVFGISSRQDACFTEASKSVVFARVLDSKLRAKKPRACCIVYVHAIVLYQTKSDLVTRLAPWSKLRPVLCP